MGDREKEREGELSEERSVGKVGVRKERRERVCVEIEKG